MFSTKSRNKIFLCRLTTFHRISHYSIYEECADPGVPVQLCICNRPEGESPRKPQKPNIYDVISHTSKVQELKPCLLFIKRAYSENGGREDFVGAEVYEFANICADKAFTVRLGAEARNVRSSTQLPIEVQLPPRSVYFASVMMTQVGFMDAKLKLKLRIVTDDLEEDEEDDGESEENAGKRSGKQGGNTGKRSGKQGENGGKRSGKQDENEKENLAGKWRKAESRYKPSREKRNWKQTGDFK